LAFRFSDCTVDFFTNFWGPKLICHTFVSFDFGPDGYVCISIETRPVKGQGYSPIAGLYRDYELYYVSGDERDIVGRQWQEGNPTFPAREYLRSDS